MFIIDRYILRTHITPYLFSLLVISFIFIMDFILRYIGLFIDKGVEFLIVLEFFVLSLGHMFALIIPMSVMPATLMAFGQLAAENEVTAMKATGISLYRMIAPVLIAGAGLSAVQVFYQNNILPESNHRLLNLMIDIGKMKPTLQIRENIFSTAIEGYTILIREKDDKTGEIRDVQIFQTRKGMVPTTIFADRGRMSFIEEESILRFELEDGEIHEMPDPQDISTYRKTLFSHFTINIQDTERALERSERTYRGDREMSARMMRERIEDLRRDIAGYRRDMHANAYRELSAKFSRVLAGAAPPPQPEGEARPLPESRAAQRQRRTASDAAEHQLQALETIMRRIVGLESQISRYRVEIHKKYSIPLSCVIFVLLGAPLAIRSGKKGMTMAIAFSIFFFLIYYVFLISGEKMADRQLLAPWVAMWMPNIILFALSILLIRGAVQDSTAIGWNRINPVRRWRKGGK